MPLKEIKQLCEEALEGCSYTFQGEAEKELTRYLNAVNPSTVLSLINKVEKYEAALREILFADHDAEMCSLCDEYECAKIAEVALLDSEEEKK